MVYAAGSGHSKCLWDPRVAFHHPYLLPFGALCPVPACPRTPPRAPEDSDRHRLAGRGPWGLSGRRRVGREKPPAVPTSRPTPPPHPRLCGPHSGRTQQRGRGPLLLPTFCTFPCCHVYTCGEVSVPARAPAAPASERQGGTGDTRSEGALSIRSHSPPTWTQETFHPGSNFRCWTRLFRNLRCNVSQSL